VNAASQANVKKTIVGGEVVYEEGEGVKGVSEEDLEEVGEESEKLWERL